MTGGMKKVLPFSKPPEQPKVSTIVVQMFGERIAIYCGVAELPPGGGSGSSQTFSFAFQNVNGYGDLKIWTS